MKSNIGEVILILFFALLNNQAVAKEQNVLMTEVFAIIVDPSVFNWTYEGHNGQFTYEASLSDSPDLPSWIHYVYSERHHCGFLYGVPPSHSKGIIALDVVGLNKKSFETRVENINIIIQEKLNSARYEVNMKIDNMNVADLFNIDRMDALKDIFSKHLWKDSEDDLYVTFLESAVEMGARKPPNPKEGEGVIVRIGSEALFSSELLELQEEVRPLYKVQPCPRDFKRTSVERMFRDADFILDWCSFRLLEKEGNNSAMHKSSAKETMAEFDGLGDEPKFSREDVPERSYSSELMLAVIVPLGIMSILVPALTINLCLEHEDIIGLSDELIVSTQDQPSPQRFLAPKTDRSSDFNMDYSISPDVMLLSRSHTTSPNFTMNRGVHCRPSPPPYIRPKYKPEI